MSLIKEIRNDPQYKKFQDLLLAVQKRIDIDRLYKETMALHESRTSRSLRDGDRYSPEKLIDANLVDLSARSRLVKIRATNAKQLSHLQEGMKAMHRYISTQYDEDLKDYRTKEQRAAVIDRVLKAANEFMAECESLGNIIDMVIKDIDQGSHAMRHVIDCLKLWTESKGRSI